MAYSFQRDESLQKVGALDLQRGHILINSHLGKLLDLSIHFYYSFCKMDEPVLPQRAFL